MLGSDACCTAGRKEAVPGCTGITSAYHFNDTSVEYMYTFALTVAKLLRCLRQPATQHSLQGAQFQGEATR